MLKIRFFRKGRKKQPFYKIVVTDKNNPPSGGRFVEDVGFYNPLTKECEIKKERVAYWMEKGAQPTGVVKNLLIKKGAIKGKKVNVVSITRKRKEVIAGKEEKRASDTENAEEMKEVVEKTIEEKKEEPLEGDIPAEEVSPEKGSEEKAEETTKETAEKESKEKPKDDEKTKEAEEEKNVEEPAKENKVKEHVTDEGKGEEKSPEKEEK